MMVQLGWKVYVFAKALILQKLATLKTFNIAIIKGLIPYVKETTGRWYKRKS